MKETKNTYNYDISLVKWIKIGDSAIITPLWLNQWDVNYEILGT